MTTAGEPVSPDDGYDARYFEPLFEVEDRHFWFRARNLGISKLAGQIVAQLEPGYRILEAGCGTGNTLRVLDQLADDGLVLGMDLFAEGLRWARQRVTCPLVQGDIHAPPFRAQFDLIGLFDVLEHLPDDVTVLRDLHRMLKPGGHLILTVPAHLSLWSYFDEAAHHCRRYEPPELKEKLGQAGYQVEFLSSYMASIFPLVWLGRRIAGRTSAKTGHDAEQADELAEQELKITPIVNGLLTLILSLEMHWIARRRSLPFGTSLVAIARKDPGH